MKIEKEILTTRGVTSRVGLQHIGLFDFDNGISKAHVLEVSKDLDGTNILWRSSKTGYHLWNLALRTKEEIALLGLEMGADCKHVASGFKRDKWVLRISPKWSGDKIYKDAPQILNVWHNHTSKEQSLPHKNLYCAITGKRMNNKEMYAWAGNSATIEQYRTFTDRMKGALGD